MSTNRNEKLATASAATPARYNRKFARRIWRETFQDTTEATPFVRMSPAWHVLRQPGQPGSFRHFTGRTVGQ
jgi:hypothetical protein